LHTSTGRTRRHVCAGPLVESCARVTICVRVWSYQQVTAIRERDVGQGQTDSVEADELSNVYIANVLVDLRRNAKREGCPNRGNNIVSVR
jgi:hypothetical protein